MSRKPDRIIIDEADDPPSDELRKKVLAWFKENLPFRLIASRHESQRDPLDWWF
jgi:hypothetical protein